MHWAKKLLAPVGSSILGLIHEEGSEGVDPSDSIEGDDHQNGEESLSDGEEVIIHWYPLDGRKDVKRLFEEESYGVGTHGGLGGFVGGQVGAVEDRDDYDQRECVGSSELGEFGGFGDAGKSVSAGDGHGGFRGFFGVMLELDFHCWGELAAGDLERIDNLSMKKSSIGGNQSLVYL